MWYKKARGLMVFGGGEGSRLALTIFSKWTELATFADPFNNTIYNHSSITMHAATTKIPHFLYEKVLLKTREWCIILFTMYDFLQWKKTYIHSNWQVLKPSIQLTLLCVDYGPEILRGEDADGLTQGSGAELSQLTKREHISHYSKCNSHTFRMKH